MPEINFTVDSHLFEELGERLVGQQHIALAELVKNGYDADARNIKITLDTENDLIRIRDDGHGMTFKEFKKFWMRIGSTHKREQEVSRHLKRPLTGSKGVGRLAVQFLAKEIKVYTVSEYDLNETLWVEVVWSEAVKAGDLTQATAKYGFKKEGGYEQGTTIILKGLNHAWGKKAIEGLAREIWWLQPPFRKPKKIKDPKEFRIGFKSKQEDLLLVWEDKQKAFSKAWLAKLVGKSEYGEVNYSLEFYGEAEPLTHSFLIEDYHLNNCDFEIRFYKLSGRQRGGITVGDLQEYMEKFAGVHIYDGGFHLPYYGQPENDWLQIQYDHSHRIEAYSTLLPQEMQVKGGLQHLPTLRRIFGVVNVDTSRERDLNPQITRDRLVQNEALEDLRLIIRTGVDFYAMERAKRVYAEKETKRDTEPASEKFQRVEEVLDYYKEDIPKMVYKDLESKVNEALEASESEAEEKVRQFGRLGPIATAGISTLAFQHELRRQYDHIEDIIERLTELEIKEPGLKNEIDELREDLTAWVNRTKDINLIFAPLADAENVKKIERFDTKKILKETIEQLKPFSRGIPINISGIEDDLLLPKASLVEWNSIFQNVLINAFNALLDADEKLIEIRTEDHGRTKEILIQDTGVGVNLNRAEKLFEPFERETKISRERQQLGYGGTGLGLTIVRLIANNRGSNVSFVEPDPGFNTAFSIRWREKK